MCKSHSRKVKWCTCRIKGQDRKLAGCFRNHQGRHIKDLSWIQSCKPDIKKIRILSAEVKIRWHKTEVNDSCSDHISWWNNEYNILTGWFSGQLICRIGRRESEAEDCSWLERFGSKRRGVMVWSNEGGVLIVRLSQMEIPAFQINISNSFILLHSFVQLFWNVAECNKFSYLKK